MSKTFGIIAVVVGILLVASSAGSDDYWEACHAAADCVAGDPPSVLSMVLEGFGGMILAVTGWFIAFNQDDRI